MEQKELVYFSVLSKLFVLNVLVNAICYLCFLFYFLDFSLKETTQS